MSGRTRVTDRQRRLGLYVPEDCPDRAKHTRAPGGYVSWHRWAERKAKTHTQHRCPTCGYFVIWKRKKAAA